VLLLASSSAIIRVHRHNHSNGVILTIWVSVFFPWSGLQDVVPFGFSLLRPTVSTSSISLSLSNLTLPFSRLAILDKLQKGFPSFFSLPFLPSPWHLFWSHTERCSNGVNDYKERQPRDKPERTPKCLLFKERLCCAWRPQDKCPIGLHVNKPVHTHTLEFYTPLVYIISHNWLAPKTPFFFTHHAWRVLGEMLKFLSIVFVFIGLLGSAVFIASASTDTIISSPSPRALAFS